MAETQDTEMVEDENYISAEDEDFAPGEDQGSSGSESEHEDGQSKKAQAKTKKPKAKTTSRNDEPAIDQDEVEGLMQDAGKKKRKRKGAGDDYDSGGEGGLVKTRSMAAAQKDEKKKTLASGAGATIDVDALWKSMNEASLRPDRMSVPEIQPMPETATVDVETASKEDEKATDDMITITETYKFAGETHTRTKQVPRDSTEAQQYLQGQPETPSATEKLGPNGIPLTRPLRRISPFDPNPQAVVKNLPDPSNPYKKPVDTKNKNKGPKPRVGIPKVKQPAKLNVVDKSKLDWNAHVKAMGARDELDAAQKAKGNYLEQQDFLDRVGGREDAVRKAAKAS